MLFDKIFEEAEALGRPRDGDLILFQLQDGRWTGLIHPILAQKFYADSYEDIELQALEYASDKSDRGITISIWKHGDFDTGKHTKVL